MKCRNLEEKEQKQYEKDIELKDYYKEKLFPNNPKWNFKNTILKDRKISEDDKKNI